MENAYLLEGENIRTASLKTHAQILFFLFFLCLFAFHAPTTVQSGDTGELVGKAYTLQIPHPPGFPLFLWLQFLFTHFIPFGTVFQKASIGNCLIACATLSFILWNTKGNGLISLAIATCLGTSPIFWKYALLPDVFALNSLLTSIVVFQYLSNKRDRINLFILATAFALGLANHPTIVFLAPMIIHRFWEEKDKKYTCKLAIYSAFIFCGLYSSLMLLDKNSLYSWGTLKNLADLIHHIMRSDYGTSRLSSQPNIDYPFFTHLTYFLRNHSLHLFPFLAVFILGGKVSGRLYVLITCICFYIIFFYSSANINPVGFGADVMERFHIFPFMLFALVGITSIRETKTLASPIIISAFFGIALVQIWNDHSEFDYSKNTITEDFVQNFLEEIAPHTCNIVVVHPDTLYAGFNYVQNTNPKFKSIIVITPGLLALSSYREKLRALGLNLPNGITMANGFDMEKDFINPNLEKCVLYFDNKFTNYRDYKLTFLPVGRIVSNGNGIHFGNLPPTPTGRRSAPSLSLDKPKFDMEKYVYGHYAHFDLAMSSFFSRQNLWQESLQHAERAILLVPYCIPAWKIRCAALAQLHL